MKIQRIDLETTKLRESRLEAVLESKGNVVPYINTFMDLDDEEKGLFYEHYMIRKKGKKPKVNPWYDKIEASIQGENEAERLAEEDAEKSDKDSE